MEYLQVSHTLKTHKISDFIIPADQIMAIQYSNEKSWKRTLLLVQLLLDFGSLGTTSSGSNENVRPEMFCVHDIELKYYI